MTGDLTGQMAGKWAIGEMSQVQGRMFFKCTCSCGLEKTVSYQALKRGKSNGCKKCSQLERYLPNHQGIYNRIQCSYKKCAKNKNRDFTLTASEFRTLVDGDCHYCGSKPANKRRLNPKKDSEIILCNGIDRVNNDLGYTKENCVSCCIICNKAKGDISQDEWLSYLDRLSVYHVTMRNS